MFQQNLTLEQRLAWGNQDIPCTCQRQPFLVTLRCLLVGALGKEKAADIFDVLREKHGGEIIYLPRLSQAVSSEAVVYSIRSKILGEEVAPQVGR